MEFLTRIVVVLYGILVALILAAIIDIVRNSFLDIGSLILLASLAFLAVATFFAVKTGVKTIVSIKEE